MSRVAEAMVERRARTVERIEVFIVDAWLIDGIEWDEFEFERAAYFSRRF